MTGARMAEHVDISLEFACVDQSRLPQAVLDMPGMTGDRTRHFYNNLCGLTFPDRTTRYLEIGVFTGSSFVSALYGNTHVRATAVDNWSEFGGSLDEFIGNCRKHLPPGAGEAASWQLLEKDCFKTDPSTDLPLAPYDIYLYDGGHSYEEQYNAIIHFWPCLADEAIIVIDDWNWSQVKAGTLDALEVVGARVAHQREIMTAFNGDCAGFWNGMAVFVVQKQRREGDSGMQQEQ